MIVIQKEEEGKEAEEGVQERNRSDGDEVKKRI